MAGIPFLSKILALARIGVKDGDKEAELKVSPSQTAGSTIELELPSIAGAIPVKSEVVLASEKAAANGVATLDAAGHIPSSQLPPLSITEVFVVSSEAAMLALTAQVGDVAVRTDLNESFILAANPASTLSNWVELLESSGVVSVNGQTGVVSLTTSNINEGSNLYFSDARAQAAITGAASTIVTAGLTSQRALISDGSGKVAVSSVTSTELSYLGGVSSGLQAQIDGKVSKSGDTMSGVLALGPVTTSGGSPSFVLKQSLVDDINIALADYADGSPFTALEGIVITTTDGNAPSYDAGTGLSNVDLSQTYMQTAGGEKFYALSVNATESITLPTSGSELLMLEYNGSYRVFSFQFPNADGAPVQSFQIYGAASPYVLATTWNAGTTDGEVPVAALSPIADLVSSSVETGGTLRLLEKSSNGTNYVGFKAADSIAANLVWTLPAADGSASQCLVTDGSGNLGWAFFPADAVTSVNGMTGAVVLGALVHPTNGSTFEYQKANASMSGEENTVIGVDAGISITNGAENTALGAYALGQLTSGERNTAVGKGALASNQTGGWNTAVGAFSLYWLNSGTFNVAIGEGTGGAISAGNYNTLINASALSDISGSVGIGVDSDGNSADPSANNQYVLGTALHRYYMLGKLESDLSIGSLSGAPKSLKFFDADESNYVALKAADVIAADVTWTLPSADGSANQVLITNGSGALSWSTITVPVTSVNGQTGDVVLTTSDIAEGTNLYFTDARARSAAVVDSSSGSQTDQASSVSAMKSYVSSALSPLELYKDAQLVMVSKSGNDSTGTGGQHKPYLTIAAALASITDASPTKRYVIKVQAGAYTEGALALKANVFIVGEQKESVRISASSYSLAADFTGSADNRSGMARVILASGNCDFNWQTVTSAAGKLYFAEVGINGTVNLYGHNNAIAQAQFDSCVFFGALTISGINVGTFNNNICFSNITMSQHPNGGMASILAATGGQCSGTVTLNATTNDFTRRCSLFAKNFYCEYLTINGPSSYADVNEGSLPRSRDRVTISNGGNYVPITMKSPAVSNVQSLGEPGYQWLYNFNYVNASTNSDLYLISMGGSYAAAGTGYSIHIEADSYGLTSNVNGGDILLTTAAVSGTGVRGKIKLDAREIDASSAKITNLAAGSASTDAVNKGQLDSAISGVSSSVSAVSARVDKLEASRGIYSGTLDTGAVLDITSLVPSGAVEYPIVQVFKVESGVNQQVNIEFSFNPTTKVITFGSVSGGPITAVIHVLALTSPLTTL